MGLGDYSVCICIIQGHLLHLDKHIFTLYHEIGHVISIVIQIIQDKLKYVNLIYYPSLSI